MFRKEKYYLTKIWYFVISSPTLWMNGRWWIECFFIIIILVRILRNNILLNKLFTCGLSRFMMLGEDLAEGQCSKGCSEWDYTWLVTSQQQ